MSREELEEAFEKLEQESPMMIRQLKTRWLSQSYLEKAIELGFYGDDGKVKPEVLEFARNWKRSS